MKKGLTNRQFVTLALIIMLCGLAIVGKDYFLSKKVKAYEEMSILLSQEIDEVVEDPEEPEEAVEVINDNGDTSGKVKKANVTYNYIGRLIIPDINLNRGFVAYGTSGNDVNQNIAIMGGSKYPDEDNSNFILAAHNGTGWNAFFTNIDKLNSGALAYVDYQGTQYVYKLTRVYSDLKSDGEVTIYNNDNKQLTLITCKRPDYRKYYLVLVFDIEYETNM